MRTFPFVLGLVAGCGVAHPDTDGATSETTPPDSATNPCFGPSIGFAPVCVAAEPGTVEFVLERDDLAMTDDIAIAILLDGEPDDALAITERHVLDGAHAYGRLAVGDAVLGPRDVVVGEGDSAIVLAAAFQVTDP
jgi:hypothetical protein